MFSRALCFAVYTLGFFTSLYAHSTPGTPHQAHHTAIPDKEIRELSNAIKAAPTYQEDLRRLLDSMEDSLASASTDVSRCDIALNLARKFRPVNTDSSLYYAHRAKDISSSLDVSYSHLSQLAIIDALSTSGLFTDAVHLFRQLGKEDLSSQTRIRYWQVGRRLFGYMRSYVAGNQVCYLKYDGLYRQYDDSLLMHLPDDSQFRQFLECERLIDNGHYNEAGEQLSKLIVALEPESNLYAMAAFQMAEVWLNLGDETQYASMLARSALCDVKGCVTEGLALPTLAEWLYDQGELGASFQFINFALEEATSGNARMRAVTIARFVPLIDDAYRDKINSSRDELMVYFLLVTVLLVVTALLIVFLVKQNRASKANAKKLALTSKRQESYIGNFIGLYSSYAERLNRLTTLISTKIASGQVAELKKLVDSGRFTDEDNDDIHKIFDSAFLDIYPDFIERINSLLRSDEQIQVKAPGSLTPELRIYAFVKLGVEESSKIAQILHYSINTVYAYRNKMRNKAVVRETFDDDIKNL